MRHFCVRVESSGEHLVTLESNMLCGKPDLTEEDMGIIRQCAEHLMAFAGPEKHEDQPTSPATLYPEGSEDCPQCGLEAESWREGVCASCWKDSQDALDEHNARFDWWDSLNDAEKAEQIKKAWR